MHTRIRTLLLTVFTILAPTMVAKADSGFSAGFDIGGERLELLGTATHRLAGIIKVCRAALYGPPNIPGEIINESDIPKRIEIEYYVPVGRERLIKMAEESLQSQYSEEQLKPFQEQILRFNQLYRDVERSDRYAMTYHPETGLTLEFNGVALGSVADPGFASAYLSIWLGDNPVSPSMKRKLIFPEK